MTDAIPTRRGMPTSIIRREGGLYKRAFSISSDLNARQKEGGNEDVGKRVHTEIFFSPIVLSYLFAATVICVGPVVAWQSGL